MRDLEIAASIEARLDERQYAAEAADRASHWHDLGWPESRGITGVTEEHILAHSPKAVLADIAARRRILERHRVLVEYDREADAKPYELKAERWRATSNRTQLLYVLEALASAWSDHPDFKPEWREEA